MKPNHCPICFEPDLEESCQKCNFSGMPIQGVPAYNYQVKIVLHIINFYALSFGFISVYQLTGWFAHNYKTLIFLDICWGAFILAYTYLNRQKLKVILLNGSLQLRPLAILMLISIWAGIAVHYFTAWLEEGTVSQVTYIFWETSHPEILSVIFICLYPAIFEELAFRGILLGNLCIISSKWVAIILSSILFALTTF